MKIPRLLISSLVLAATLLGNGMMLAQEKIVPSAEVIAMREKAEKGEAYPQFSLGNMYLDGRGVTKDEVEGVKWYRKAADQGYAPAQYFLGRMYADGRGVPKDVAEEMKWSRKAAEQGYAPSQNRLGEMYLEGVGATKDAAEAVKWFRKAANQGYVYAQNTLGEMYANGPGIPKDASEAYKWFSIAAAQGAEPAKKIAELVGNLLTAEQVAEGQKRVREFKEQWIKAAPVMVIKTREGANEGDTAAQFSLGSMYYDGRDMPKDKPEAAKWFRKAADQGHVSAQFYIGLMYQYGSGVPKDEVEAYKWWLLADGQGHETSKKSIEDLGGKLTPAQRAEGQKRAREFKKK